MACRGEPFNPERVHVDFLFIKKIYPGLQHWRTKYFDHGDRKQILIGSICHWILGYVLKFCSRFELQPAYMIRKKKNTFRMKKSNTSPFKVKWLFPWYSTFHHNFTEELSISSRILLELYLDSTVISRLRWFLGKFLPLFS